MSVRTKVRPTVLAFIIVFVFNFYALHQSSETAAANKRTASAQTALAQIQAKQAKKEATDNCNAINGGRKAAHDAAVRLGAAQVGQAEGLKARFVQSFRLNPPKTVGELESYSAGSKFFDSLIQDTKTLTASAVSELDRSTSSTLHCS